MRGKLIGSTRGGERRRTGAGIGAETGHGRCGDDGARRVRFRGRSLEHGFGGVLGCEKDALDEELTGKQLEKSHGGSSRGMRQGLG